VRPDRGQRQAVRLAPGKEPRARPRIGPPRIRVADVGGEELDITPAGSGAGTRRSSASTATTPGGLTAGAGRAGVGSPRRKGYTFADERTESAIGHDRLASLVGPFDAAQRRIELHPNIVVVSVVAVTVEALGVRVRPGLRALGIKAVVGPLAY
jgi:hypothetical protein